MKNTSGWMSTVSIALLAAACIPAHGGVILISTRYQQDTQFSATEYISDERGPGMTTPGDVAMASVLGDHGYSCRLILDKLLGPGGALVIAGSDPAMFLQPVSVEMAPMLAIMSGSGASADTPPPPPGVPIMMGEHVCLGNNAARQGSLFMYNGTGSSDPNSGTTPAVSQYMKVIAPDHPILKGIPLDDQGHVKIFRDRYPEEELHVPPGGKANYEWRWCTQVVADAAPGTTVLGVLDGATERSCFAVVEEGGVLANTTTATARLVHIFLNENGSGGSRRVFQALTEMGRVIFVRAAKWAMGEELAPYKTFQIKEVTSVGANRVKLSWDGSSASHYSIRASDDLYTWTTVAADIAGADEAISRTLDTSAAPGTLFLRVSAMP